MEIRFYINQSIVIRKIESSFEINFNLENKDFLSSIPIIEVKGDMVTKVRTYFTRKFEVSDFNEYL